MKNLLFIKLIIILFLLVSCETDIPNTDTVQPQFSFRITGDGFDHEFNQDEDFSNKTLKLKSDSNYNFIFSGSDSGGVKLIQWQLPISDYIEFVTVIPDTWLDNVTGLSRMIQWNGNSNNPLTANILSGTFEANGENASGDFRFFVSDFGGESGISNSVSKELNIFIGNHTTELIEN